MRRCPKCRQAIVSCNDYFFCWRHKEKCAMRAWHVESLRMVNTLFEAEEEFLEWLFERFLGLSDNDDKVRIAVAGHLSVKVDAEPIPKKAEAPAGGAVGGGGAYQPESSPFANPDRPD